MSKSKTWFHVKMTHEVTIRAMDVEEAERLAIEGLSHKPHFHIDITPATKDQIRPYKEVEK